MKSLAKVLSTFFGLGFFPLAPGTLCSALVVLSLRLSGPGLPQAVLLLICVGLFFLGTWAAGAYAASLGSSDPGRIVIDEACGQILVLALVPAGRLSAVLAFVFFRIFDILKPFPLRQLERLPGGWGIMADDIGAGLAAAAAVQLVLYLFRIVRIS